MYCCTTCCDICSDWLCLVVAVYRRWADDISLTVLLCHVVLCLHITYAYICVVTESSWRLQDNEKRYLQQTQKNKIAAIRDKSNLVPLKWRAANQRRAAREAITENYKNRKDMIRAFKTVVNAQER